MRNCQAMLLLVLAILLPPGSTLAASLADTLLVVKPSIVGIGTHLPTRQPRSALTGTGFVVGDGTYVITNAHVVAGPLDTQRKERRVAFVGVGKNPRVVDFTVVRTSPEHDLALLRLQGARLPALALGDSSRVREGEYYAFTGFPIGAVLGLYPVTHRGIVSSITPMAVPAFGAQQLNSTLIKRLREPYDVFQLDATAYPGNSGSPLYRMEDGAVVGVINKVFVKETKEQVLTSPEATTILVQG